MVSSNLQICHFLTQSGIIYAQGFDNKNCGLLGLGDNDAILEPYPL
jgi:hypothetical protein